LEELHFEMMSILKQKLRKAIHCVVAPCEIRWRSGRKWFEAFKMAAGALDNYTEMNEKQNRCQW